MKKYKVKLTLGDDTEIESGPIPVPDKTSDLTNNSFVTGSSLTANYFVVGNGGRAAKISSMQPSTSSTTWSTTSDVYVPTMKAISNYVSGAASDTNYYAVSIPTSSNGTKIATGYSSGTASTTYDLYVYNGTESQAGILQLGTTATTAAKGNHTHTTSIAQSGSSGTSLSANTWYTLTAGGTTVTFKTPSDGNTNYYPIRSYTSGLQISSYSGSTNCQLYVPNAASDQAGVVTTGDQTFAGRKTFNSSPVMSGIYNSTYSGNVVDIGYNTTDGVYLGSYGHLIAGGDDGSNVAKPNNNTGITTPYTQYFNTGIAVGNATNLALSYKLSFPAHSGTLAVTSDFSVNTTTGSESVSANSNSLNVVTRGTDQTIAAVKTFGNNGGPTSNSLLKSYVDVTGLYNSYSHAAPSLKDFQSIVLATVNSQASGLDTYKTSIVATRATANRTITLPNATGTVALNSIDNNFSASQTFPGIYVGNGGQSSANCLYLYDGQEDGYATLTAHNYTFNFTNSDSSGYFSIDPMGYQIIINGGTQHTYSFPAKDGTVALTSDLPQIVDLR